jgi:hypothetical protein
MRGRLILFVVQVSQNGLHQAGARGNQGYQHFHYEKRLAQLVYVLSDYRLGDRATSVDFR